MDLNIGDIVARKSYGGDVYFKIVDIIKGNRDNVYVLKGLLHRLSADSHGEDLVKHSPEKIYRSVRNELYQAERLVRSKEKRKIIRFGWFRSRPAKILHIDGDMAFMQRCIQTYTKSGIRSVGKAINEAEQPKHIMNLLMREKPDILVVTGHDSMKKGTNANSIENYANSRYFAQCVQEARKYEPSADKLCIFAGACQSYFENIMAAGANFASSPGRILINALDPALVAEKIATTDRRVIVTPQEIADLTISGREGIGGIDTRGRLFVAK